MVKSLKSDLATNEYGSSSVLKANRSLLALVLVPGFTVGILEAIGLGPGLSLAMAGTVTLLLIAFLFRDTPYSPISVLKGEKKVNIPLALGLTALLLAANEGSLFFLGAFIPSLLEVVPPLAGNSAIDTAFLLVAVVLIIPFYEELIFRGAALNAYSAVRSPKFAILFTAVLFALVHGSIAQSLAILPMGIVLALVVFKTGQLWTAIFVHALHNLIAVVSGQFGMYEVGGTPLVGVVGLIVAVMATAVAVKWVGWSPPQSDHVSQQPSEEASRKLWSASLIAVIIIGVASVATTTYMAFSGISL